MSITLSDFLSAWNEIMPVQIREAEIKTPSEQNLRIWLIAILRQFFVDTQAFENMDHESGNTLRSSRVRLVATVNHFYKIAMPGTKQDFVYFDLIQPTFKRVFNVLNCLLNYVNFVRYVYTETIYDAKTKLRKIDEMRSVKNQLRTEIEQAKIREENNVKSIRDLESKIPRQKAINEDLEKKEKRLREDLVRIQTDSEKSDLNLIEVNNELREIENLVVSDQEVNSILATKQAIEEQLEEQEQITAAGRQMIKANSHAIEEARKITAKMESLLATVNIDDDELKTKKKNVSDLKVEVEALRSNIAKITLEIESTSQNLQLKKKNIAKLMTKRDEVKKSYSAKESELKKELKETENLLWKLSAQEATLASTNKRLRDELEYLFKLASNVIKHMSSQIYVDKLQQTQKS